MPTTSKKKQKSRSIFDREKFTAELSSGQLVVGISILILFGLTCFLLGILLGRSEYTRSVEYANNQRTQGSESNDIPGAPSGEEPLNLGNVPPTIHRLPAPQPPDPIHNPEAEALSSLTNDSSTPIPPAESSPPAEDDTASSEIAIPDAISVSPEPTEQEAPVIEVPEPLVTSVDITNAPYSVQVGAFGKRVNAEAAKKKIESKTSYPVQLIDMPENKVTVVLAGAFPDRSAAETARVILREKLGYTDSYIKKNNK